MTDRNSTTGTADYDIVAAVAAAQRVVTMNKKVAVTPFADMAVKTSARGTGAVKVGIVENRVTLTALTVVLPSEDGRFRPGYVVLVRSDLFTQPWAKEVHTVGDKTFILLPETSVEVLQRS